MAQAPTQQQYEIKGQPLIAVPEIFQLRNNALGKDAVRLMNERYAGNNHVVLDISGLANDQPIGYSNPYRRFALGPIVRELAGNNVQLLTPALSELALSLDKFPGARGTYEDLAVVVYSTRGANAQLAQHLVEQAKERGTEIKFPLVIYGLETVKDDRFPDGLGLDLGNAAVAYNVPILSKGGNFDANDPELVKTGFPSKLGSGNRILYTTNDGVRRVNRDWNLDLDAVNVNLPNSLEAGRVSFVKGAAPQNLEAALEAVEAEVRRQEAAVEARKVKAVEILGGVR